MGSISPTDAMGPGDDAAKHPKHLQKGTDPASRTKGSIGPEMGARNPDEARAQSGLWVGRFLVADILLRSAVIAFSVVSLCAMFTSTQHSEVHILGFEIGISMRWNRSQPFKFLVVVNLLVCAYALAQFVHQSVILVKKAQLTRRHMLLQLAADQACTYLVIAAAAAAAGASRTNKSAFRTLGVEDIHVSGVCTVLDKFCNRATIAFTFTLLAAFASAMSVAVDVYLLTLAC